MADVSYSTTAIDKVDSGTTVIVAAADNQRVVVYEWYLSAAGATSLTWKSDSTAISGPHRVAADGDGHVQENSGIPKFRTASGEGLVLGSTASVDVGGHVTYRYEPGNA